MIGGGFQGLIFTLQNWGVMDVILPFILIFTIVFAVFEQTGILGGKNNAKNRKYSTMIALVMAFAVVTPHVTGQNWLGFSAVDIINRALPQVGLLLVAIVMMLLTIGLWTGKKADGSKGIGVWFTLLSGIIVIAIFVSSIGVWQLPTWLWWLLNNDVLALIIAILVFGLIIRFIAGSGDSDEKKKDAARKRRQKYFENFLGGSDDDD